MKKIENVKGPIEAGLLQGAHEELDQPQCVGAAHRSGRSLAGLPQRPLAAGFPQGFPAYPVAIGCRPRAWQVLQWLSEWWLQGGEGGSPRRKGAAASLPRAAAISPSLINPCGFCEQANHGRKHW